VAVSDFSIIGRNTQGVRIMSLDEGDALAAIVRVPPEEKEDAEVGEADGAGEGAAGGDAAE
jgi:DNA gyrase subunit A